MKSFTTTTAAIVITALLLSSCSIEKRVHLSGHHVEWFFEGKSNLDVHRDLHTNKQHKSTCKSNEPASLQINTEVDNLNSEKSILGLPHEVQDNIVFEQQVVSRKKNSQLQDSLSENTIATTISNPTFNTNSNTPIENTTQPTTNGKALTGFVCSLVGLFVFGTIFGTIGIIFSAIGLNKINKDPIKWKGKGMAIAGLVIGIVDIIASLLLLALIL